MRLGFIGTRVSKLANQSNRQFLSHCDKKSIVSHRFLLPSIFREAIFLKGSFLKNGEVEAIILLFIIDYLSLIWKNGWEQTASLIYPYQLQYTLLHKHPQQSKLWKGQGTFFIMKIGKLAYFQKNSKQMNFREILVKY